MKIKILFLLIAIHTQLEGQTLYRRNDIAVETASGTALTRAWDGGFNAPQFSNIDLNADGKQDLFVFDKCDNSVNYYLQTSNGNYEHSHSNHMQLPADLAAWCVLVDYNCDAIPDIFTYSLGLAGAKVYTGAYNASTGFTFTLIKDRLRFPSGTGYPNIYITQLDLPAFVDLDNDNDVDVLTFSFTGDFIEMYQNQSQELGYGCDSLIYTQATMCWGEVKESALDNTISMGISCKTNPNATSNGGSGLMVHSGSSITAFDYDYDGDCDVLLGDVSNPTLTHLINAGDSNYAVIGAVTYGFPDYNTPANIPVFPGAFYVDVNNDTKKDLVVSTNISNNTKYLNNVSMYENRGIAVDSFVLINDSFLVGDMIDVGKGAYPVFVDVTNDGLLDLVLGNNSYYGYPSGTVEESALTVFKNTGTATTPVYQLLSRNWLNTRGYAMTNLHPTLGDVDTDGDVDMLLGNSAGSLIFLENVSSSGAMSFAPPSVMYQGIDVGSVSAPQLVDVDEDGKLDLLIGEIQGRVFYYQNTGTASVPVFSLVSNHWGEVDVRVNSSTGYSKPHLTKKLNGSVYELLVGSESGQVFRYDNITTIANDTFGLVDTVFTKYGRCKFACPTVADLDADGNIEVVLGSLRGGLVCYTTDTAFNGLEEHETNHNLYLYPNPTMLGFYIKPPNETATGATVSLYDASGRCVSNTSLSSDYFISTSNLSIGIYVVVLQLSNSIYRGKIAIQH
jgi:hypothetical protein